jgi:hypothetical protein
MSTLCINTLHNVAEGRREAENSTFCIPLPGSLSTPPLTFSARAETDAYQR